MNDSPKETGDLVFFEQHDSVIQRFAPDGTAFRMVLWPGAKVTIVRAATAKDKGEVLFYPGGEFEVLAGGSMTIEALNPQELLEQQGGGA